MLPKDWDEMKGIVDALLKGLIGTTKDTGGSQTAGTVMGKENAILKMVGEVNAVVTSPRRMRITEHAIASNAEKSILFDFGKTVKFNYFKFSGGSGKAIGNGTVYFINGEDSISYSINYNPNGETTYVPALISPSSGQHNVGFSYQVTQTSSVIQAKFDFYADKIQLDFNAGLLGVKISVCYVE